ncbi:hypothetical protein GW17_00044073 [Ensete ventricosum]|nr:hypothetical protein GW17_00044073 [Ensete ventricosum]
MMVSLACEEPLVEVTCKVDGCQVDLRCGCVDPQCQAQVWEMQQPEDASGAEAAVTRQGNTVVCDEEKGVVSNVGKATGILLRALLEEMPYFCRESEVVTFQKRSRPTTTASQKRSRHGGSDSGYCTWPNAMGTRCHLIARKQLTLGKQL